METPAWKPTSLSTPGARRALDTRQVNTKGEVLSFGILLEPTLEGKALPIVINAVTRDLLNLLSSASAGTRIQVLSPSIKILKDCLSSAIDVDFISTTDYSSCKLWKSYWVYSKPPVPPGVVINFNIRVTDPSAGGGTPLSKGMEIQLPAYDIPKPAPPGFSPNNIQAPPRTNAPSQILNLYPWLG